MRTGKGRRRRAPGFAYLALLAAVAVLGISAAGSLSLGASMARRDAERQLLVVGLEFQQALRSYAGTPGAAGASMPGSGPRALDQLLRDPRVPGLRRHLRQIYADPMTGRAEWGLVRDPQGGIVGIHSLASGRPIARAGFPPQLSGFDNAESYRGWVFGLPQAQGQASPPGATISAS